MSRQYPGACLRSVRQTADEISAHKSSKRPGSGRGMSVKRRDRGTRRRPRISRVREQSAVWPRPPSQFTEGQPTIGNRATSWTIRRLTMDSERTKPLQTVNRGIPFQSIHEEMIVLFVSGQNRCVALRCDFRLARAVKKFSGSQAVISKSCHH